MSDQIQIDQPPSLHVYAIDATEPFAISQKTYWIGRLLDEVRVEPGLGWNERQVASAMCFEAMDDGLAATNLYEVARMAQLSESKTRKALQKLILAGFVRVVRDSEYGLTYELQFPDDCVVI